MRAPCAPAPWRSVHSTSLALVSSSPREGTGANEEEGRAQEMPQEALVGGPARGRRGRVDPLFSPCTSLVLRQLFDPIFRWMPPSHPSSRFALRAVASPQSPAYAGSGGRSTRRHGQRSPPEGVGCFSTRAAMAPAPKVVCSTRLCGALLARISHDCRTEGARRKRIFGPDARRARAGCLRRTRWRASARSGRAQARGASATAPDCSVRRRDSVPSESCRGGQKSPRSSPDAAGTPTDCRRQRRVARVYARPPPAPSSWRAGRSAMSTSVVSMREATDAAFCNAIRTTLVGSITPATTRSS